MFDLFNKHDRMPIPRDVDECSTTDATTRELWNISDAVETWGAIILIGIIFLGILASFATNNFINDITREEGFSVFLSSIAVWAVVAIAEYVAYRLIALFIRSLAAIVQNTNVSAKVALYNASKSVSQVTNPNNHTSRTPVPPPVAKRVSIEGYSKDNNGETITPQHTDAGEIICPKCGKTQRADRTICWNCNQKFS